MHGGAGNRQVVDEQPYHEALRAALEAGRAALDHGALAAAVAAVVVLEDAPLFNAGRGSVATSEGTIEMDAAVMDGRSGGAGAVAAVRRVRNPVLLARAVMEHSPHVMLAADGAERFAAEHGIEPADDAWLASRAADPQAPGTVGAVVLDAGGALAAATSTGGRRGQHPGRVGDTPLIGAGTWADGRRAISMTGEGEAIVRGASAHTIALSDAPLGDACDDAVAALGGAEAGLIAIDRHGAIAMPFNTRAMNRGWWEGGDAVTAISRGRPG